MTPYPKISIVTPSYNQGNYIEQTICSVLDQKYPNLEYFIFDGGSSDQTISVLKKYHKHITYWESCLDNGQSDAINKGLKLISGEIFNWLNSDDYYVKDALFKVADSFLEKPLSKVVCGRSFLFNEKGVVQESSGTDVYRNNLAKTIGWARVDQPETFYRRSAIEKMGLLNPNFHFTMDREWWIRYLMIYGLEYVLEIKDSLVNFRLHPDSKTVSQSQQFEKENLLFYFSLAKTYGFNLEASALEQVYPEVFTNSSCQGLAAGIIKSSTPDLVKSALHYFLLYLADYNYYIHERAKAKILLSFIDAYLLAKEDKNLLTNLKKKVFWLPVWMVKSLREWK